MRRKNRIAVLFAVSIVGALACQSYCQTDSSRQAKQITCTGKVLDTQDRPVVGAEVILHRLTVNPEAFTYDVEQLQKLTTEEDGKFILTTDVSKDDLSGQAIVMAEKEGSAIGWANWRLKEDVDVEIKLERPQVISGIVVDDADKPIPDAEVSITFLIVTSKDQPQYLVGTTSLKLLMTKTDTEGRFSFGRIPTSASAEFLVKKPGKATVSTFNPENYRGQSLQFAAGQTDIKIALPEEARIQGIVVEKATGRPVAGIHITARKGRNQPGFGVEPVVSAEDGTFGIDALDEGTYAMQIVSPPNKEAEWIAESVEVTTEPGKISSDVKIELSKGGLLEVVITEAMSKKSVETARVSVRHEARNEYFSAASDENGIARIRLVPGQYQMGGVYADGYSRKNDQETVTIEDGKTTRLELELKEQPKISGVVRDEQGKPVRGVKLQVCPMGTGQNVTSDAQGKFEVSWDPGRWHSSETPAMILLARYEQGNLAGTVEIDEDTRTQDVTLRTALTITGRVIDPDGKGIAGARVITMLQGPRWGSSIGRNQPTADEDGRFEIKALPAENSYTFSTSAEGYGENRSKEINADDAVNNRLDIGSITLAVADLSVSGIVVDNEDKPVPGARVYSYGDNQPNRNTQTGPEGKFTLEGICAGKIRISASKSGADGLYGNVETEGGATNVKIILSNSPSSTRYVPKQPPSLIGKPLPDLKGVKIDLPKEDLAGKVLIVCFFDMQQRPSRNCLRQLNANAQALKSKNIMVVGVQASIMDEKSLQDWCKEYGISFPVGIIKDDEEKTRFTWGIKSLPWIILTNNQHVVTSNGFGIRELDEKIEAGK